VNLRRSLYGWYRARRRELPWRQSSDPYRIWVSEVMLQQTRVDQVVAHYRRFLERFPDLTSLAEASPDEVLAAWSGLGYYRRARQLHAAARQVLREGGSIPSSVASLRRLPGIGEYTAAAVASIAFGVHEAAVDGNVERVLSRLLALEEAPRSAAGRRRIRAAAAALLDPADPGDGNQALMELGALVCLPRNPDCEVCPLREGCQGAASGRPDDLPLPAPRRRPERHRWRMVLVEEGGRVLLFRRPDDSPWLPGTWELPWIEEPGDETDPSGALALRYGGRWRLYPVEVGRLRHAITHRQIEVRLQRGEVTGAEAGTSREGVRFGAEELPGLPLSSLVGKALAAARISGGDRRRRRG
jgi:A/G-specific adenine glycosylase